LRERTEDIETLVDYFLRVSQTSAALPVQVSGEAMQLLRRYSWPGNVRQLRSAIQHGLILCAGGVIRPGDLPDELCHSESSAAMRLRDVQEQLELPPEGIDLPAFLAAVERKFLQQALSHCHGNQVRAAQLLHMSRDQLRYRLGRS
jgi:two-component system response regulator AtoC